jgi:hypothetical protein
MLCLWKSWERQLPTCPRDTRQNRHQGLTSSLQVDGTIRDSVAMVMRYSVRTRSTGQKRRKGVHYDPRRGTDFLWLDLRSATRYSYNGLTWTR